MEDKDKIEEEINNKDVEIDKNDNSSEKKKSGIVGILKRDVDRNFVIVLAVVFLAITLMIIASTIEKNENVVSDDGKYTLMDLGGKGCIPCDELQPVLASLREKYEGEININYYDVNNTKEGSELAREYNISTIPTLIFLDENGEEVNRLEGFYSQDALEGEFLKLGWIS